jgi:glycosyltransferase involved in cell wall biosynthesis
MKILLTTPEYPPYGSGIANVVYMLRSHLSKKGVNVDVLSQGGADINIISTFNAPGLFRLVPFWQKAVDYILKKSDDYDAVWLHSPLLINAKKLRHIRKIMMSFHVTYYGHYRAYKMHGISYLLPYYYLAIKLEHYFLKQLSYCENVTITAISPSVAEELHKNGLIHHINVVPNGFEIEHPALFDKPHVRELVCKKYSLQLSKKDIVLLYVGRITEIKQPLLLIDLFKAISSIKLNIHLIIVGSGNLFAKMRKKAICHPNIHILGYVPHQEIWPLLRAADAFISLSFYEGLPLAALEAASFGLPLILSDIPAHRFIINSKVGNGILIDSHNPCFMEICNFLNNIEKKKLITDASLMKQFTWENVVKQYLTLLSSQ